MASTIASAALAANGDGVGLQPFTATFAVQYSGMSVGASELTLAREPGNGRWTLRSRSSARGFARLVVGSDLVQESQFEAGPDGLRPLRYRFDDGTSSHSKDVSLQFDWTRGRVQGTAKERPVDLEAPSGLQDSLSLQIAAMLDLQAGRTLARMLLIESDEVKEYRYVREGTARIETPYGPLDTVIYRSERVGGNRYTRLWYAPSLGYFNVKAEQYKGDKRLFSLTLASYAARN